MDILGPIKKVLDVAQPIRQASEAVAPALTPAPVADPTGQKAAVAAGQAARQAAINRGKGIEVKPTPTGDFSTKKF